MRVRYTEDYPLHVYEYDAAGYHHGSFRLENKADLERYIRGRFMQLLQMERKVIITDRDDYCCVHAEDGKMVWPTLEMLVVPKR